MSEEATAEATEANSQEAAPKASPSLPTCKCGNTRLDEGKDPYIEAQCEFGTWGWFSLLWGVTATPTRVGFRCRRCNTQFDVSTDPAVLKKYR